MNGHRYLGEAVIAAHCGVERCIAHATSGVDVSLGIEQEFDGLDPAEVRRDL